MDRKVEQRANMKFCVKLGKSVTETLNMLRQPYGDEAMSRMQCFEWHRCFKGGRTSLEDEEGSGRPSMSITPENVERIRELVHADRRRTINGIADIVGVSYGSVQTILTSELNTWRVSAKFVPRLLTPEQKEHHVAVCQDLRERAADNPSFMSRIITGDKSWVCGYDPETKRQSSQWKSP
jgi:histone-lysine N-methyltransferase SETMAR